MQFETGALLTGRWFEMRVYPSAQGLTVQGQDVTERKQAAEDLRERERRFRSAIEHLPNCVAIYDKDRRFCFVNAAAILCSGFKEKSYLGRRDEDLFPPEVTDTYLPALQRVCETRTPQDVESTFVLGGRRFTMLVNYVPLLDERGEIYEILGITHDITERKQAEERLHEREAYLRLMLGQIPATVWTTDPQLRFTSSAGSGLAVLNLEPDQVRGLSLFDYYKTRDAGFLPIAAHLRACRESPATMSCNGRAGRSRCGSSRCGRTTGRSSGASARRSISRTVSRSRKRCTRVRNGIAPSPN